MEELREVLHELSTQLREASELARRAGYLARQLGVPEVDQQIEDELLPWLVTLADDSRTQPDLVILELQMGSPETGWQILNLLRGDPTTTHIPALMYSAHSDFLRVRAGVLRRQRCATLEKPFALPDLLATIAEALALRGPG